MRKRTYILTPGRALNWKHQFARARRTADYKKEAWLLLTRNRRWRFVQDEDDLDIQPLSWSSAYCALELCTPKMPEHDPKCRNYREQSDGSL